LGANRLPEGIKLLEQVRAVRETKFGPDDPQTLDTLHNLAGAYHESGKLAEAIKLFEQVAAARRTKLGPDHQRTLATLANLAVAYSSAKQLDKSISLHEQVLNRREAKLGRTHPDTLHSAASLGVRYRDAGRLDEAIPLLEEAYQKGRGVPELAWVGIELVAAYAKAGKKAEASRLIQEQVTTARERFSPESAQLAGLLAIAGKQLLELKLYNDAEPIVRECLRLREKLVKSPAPGTPGSAVAVRPWQVANAQSLLGAVLTGQKKYVDAEPLLLAGVKGLIADEKAIPPQGKINIDDSIRRLIELYEATGNTEEAAKWRQQQDERAKP
jgi:tetratricopeptide (TPR) repeat protein